jgi:hypothetical protein
MAFFGGGLGAFAARRLLSRQATQFAVNVAEEVVAGALGDGIQYLTGAKVYTPPPTTPGGVVGVGAYAVVKPHVVDAWNAESPSSVVQQNGYQASVNHISRDGCFMNAYSVRQPGPSQTAYMNNIVYGSMGLTEPDK